MLSVNISYLRDKKNNYWRIEEKAQDHSPDRRSNMTVKRHFRAPNSMRKIRRTTPRT